MVNVSPKPTFNKVGFGAKLSHLALAGGEMDSPKYFLSVYGADGSAASEAWRECKTRPRTKDQGNATPCEARNYHLVPLGQVVVVH